MLMNRALVASDRGDTEQAQRLINQAIVFQTQVLHDKPGNPHAADLLFRNYWNLGEVCIKAGQAASAASAAEMLVTNFPKRLAAYRHAATLLIECARLTGHAVDRADTDPAPPKKSQDSEIAQPSYDGRVTAQNYLLRAEELVAHAKHVADKNPDSTIDFAMFLLLCKHESFRDAHTALELAQSAVRDYPERGRAWFALALADYRLGNWQAAEEAEKKSAKLSRGEQADKPEAYDWLLLSMIRAKQGRIDDAATWYAKAADWIAESKPNDQELLQLAAEAKLLSSDIAKQASTPEPK
jgi:tetratricopeptide (TPR) repeat protein